MADVKISQLPVATTPVAGTEVLPIVQSSITAKVSIDNLTAGRAVSMTSVTVAAGAVGTPSITTAGDTNTGIFFPAADTIAFAEGGAEAMRIDSSGNLGLGTSSPTANTKLTIQFEAGAITGAATLAAYGGSPSIGFRQASGTVASPGASNTSVINLIGASTSDGTNFFNTVAIQGNMESTATAGSHPTAITFATTPSGSTSRSERMRITSAGDVGIGTSSPQRKLHSYGGASDNCILATSLAGNAFIGFADVGTTDQTGLSVRMGSSGNGMVFQTGGTTERMRIDNSGNLLVGTTGGAGRLRVVGSDATSSNIAFQAYNSASASLFYIRNDGLINTGNTTSSPTNFTTGAAANMYVDAGGNLYRSTSSLKYKTDVQDAAHGLAEVMSLRPVTYKGKNDGDTVFGGLIAEEVHAAGLTEFVQYAPDGSPDALYYGNMVSLCIKAIQELKAEFDAYKSTHP
jgi:hypothetical protein